MYIHECMDFLVDKLIGVHGQDLLLSIIDFLRASSEFLDWTGGGETASILIYFALQRLLQGVSKQTSYTGQNKPAVSAQGSISTPPIKSVWAKRYYTHSLISTMFLLLFSMGNMSRKLSRTVPDC